ncbi:hypothetical protein [Anthocerotibacter panamensis]|uniref:hypothetical protein n=1 Tax=Anthocerotibacter panamensis TaxID=2857077 RepID=UPI001C403D5D|nr:hypothetical protein [Anthocerotibacter panamensis]
MAVLAVLTHQASKRIPRQEKNLGPRLLTGAEQGLDPTPETIHVGTVRMEAHPEHERR